MGDVWRKVSSGYCAEIPMSEFEQSSLCSDIEAIMLGKAGWLFCLIDFWTLLELSIWKVYWKPSAVKREGCY